MYMLFCVRACVHVGMSCMPVYMLRVLYMRVVCVDTHVLGMQTCICRCIRYVLLSMLS